MDRACSANPTQSKREDGWGARGRMKDASSTDVVVHNGKALTSFWQCGDLYELDPRTLETTGKAAWADGFPSPTGISAHTKVDERTGELLVFGYGKDAPYMHYGVVSADGRLEHSIDVPLPGPRLPHDMAFTEHYAILNDLPLFWDPDLLAQGVHLPRFYPDVPSRFAIVPRRGSTGRHPLVRGRPHLRPALDQRLRGRRRGRARRLLPARSVSPQARLHATRTWRACTATSTSSSSRPGPTAGASTW